MIFENRLITVWSSRNGYRLNPYHRMIYPYYKKKIISSKRSRNRKINGNQKELFPLNFSVYNLYNRQNPYFIFFTWDPIAGNLDLSAYQVSLFPILPSITWNFKF